MTEFILISVGFASSTPAVMRTSHSSTAQSGDANADAAFVDFLEDLLEMSACSCGLVQVWCKIEMCKDMFADSCDID